MQARNLLVLAISTAVLLSAPSSWALNVQKELKKQGCLKCHAISRKKDGPSIKEIAEKYKDKEGGAAELKEHLTKEPMIEVDGKEEKHKKFEAKEPTDLDEVVEWVLSK